MHQAKRAALLAYLAAAVPRGAHRRDKLLALFWPELDQARARAALNQTVYVLREALGADALGPRGDGALGVTEVVWCDATAFEAALDAGNPAEALALYRGDLLEGFFISDAPEFERWLDGERERLRRRASEGAWMLAEARAAEGDLFEAQRWARRGADLFPADEAGARRLMKFLHALGDRAAAIRAFEVFAERLAQEYELEPSAETRALAATIRQDERPAAAPRSVVVRPALSTGAGAAAPRAFPLGGLAIAAAVVSVIAAGAWALLGRPEVAPRPLVRFTLEFPADHQIAPTEGGPRFALSPDGSQLVYLARGLEGTQLFLRSIDRVEAVPIPHTRGARLGFFSPDGEWLGFVTGNEIRKVPLGGGPAITVCKVATNVPGASWGPNDVIVFATPAGLWRVPSSGGDPRLLAPSDTARGERYRWPEVLPNGRTAVFAIADDAGFHLAAVALGTGAVRVLGIEGTSPHFVAPGYLLFGRTDGVLLAVPLDPNTLRVTGRVAAVAEGVQVGGAGAGKLGVSQVGTLVYEPEPSGDRTFALVDRAGKADAVPLPSRRFIAARFSGDGRRIATAVADGQSTDLWLADLDANTIRRVTFDSGSVSPLWSPDGRRIVFGTKPGGRQFGWTVRWVSADSDSTETLLAADWGQFPGSFTPDGRILVVTRRHPETGWDTWTLTLDGRGGPQPYLNGPSDEHSADVSPDGRWLAYVSNESGRDEVYVRAFPAPGSPVQVSSGGAREPRWAPNGRELFYRNEQGLVVAAISASSSFRVGRRAVLFDDKPYLSHTVGAAYDVHPDGRRFLLIRRGPESHQVVVVLNWLDQLRAAGSLGAGVTRP